MDENLFNRHRKAIRDLLLVFFGAAAVLLLTSWDGVGFAQLPYGGPNTYFAWFIPWSALLIGSLAILLMLTTNKHWRADISNERMQLIFGYIGIIWLCMAAFVLQVSNLLNAAHLVVVFWGAVLLAVYLGYRLRRGKPQEMFP